MIAKENMFRVALVAIWLLFATCMLAILLLILIQFAHFSGRDVVPPLIKQSTLARKLFLSRDYRVLMRELRKQVGDSFMTVINFDQARPLLKSMFIPTEMFGVTRYRFRPNVTIDACRVWSGLFYQTLWFVETPDTKASIAKIDAHCFIFKTDNDGFKPTGLSPLPNSKTILFLGDSFTEGLWINPEQTFVSLFGQKLRSLGLSMIPINLGLRGYGVLEEDWMLEHFAPLFNPTIVFVNLFPNDVAASHNDAVAGKVPQGNYDIMFSYLNRIQYYCKEHDIKLVIAVIPTPHQFGKLRGFSVFQDKVKAWSDARGILFLDPRAYFEQVGADKLYIPWDGHFSGEGHAQYANFLYQHTRALLSGTTQR